MHHFQVLVAVALAVPAFDSAAESGLLQDARRNAWTVLAERPVEKLPPAPLVSPEGAEFGWVRSSGLKPGSSLQLDLAPGWAVCADWDRQRPKTQVRETIDTFLLGLYYRF